MRRKRKRKPNDYRHNDDGTTTIFLGGKTYPDKETLVDTKYWPEVSQLTWRVKRETRGRDVLYVIANRYIDDRRTTVELHRFLKELQGLVKPGGSLRIDHLDGNGLNNTGENLDVGTHRDNMRSRGQPTHYRGNPLKSEDRGIYQNAAGEYWAYKKDGEERCRLGPYLNKTEARTALDKKTVEIVDGHVRNPKKQLHFPERLEEYLAEIYK